MTDEWFTQKHLPYLRNLMKLSETQQQLLALHDTPNRTPLQDKALRMLVVAERRACDLLQRSGGKTKADIKGKALAEQAKNRQIFEVAKLLTALGLLDKHTGALAWPQEELVGALLEAQQQHANNATRTHWQQLGADYLARQKPPAKNARQPGKNSRREDTTAPLK